MDVRKWSAKWRNWNISDIFISLSSIEGRKQRRRPEKFAPCMGTMSTERTLQENGFSRFKQDRFDISDTPRSGIPSGFDDVRLNTLIHNDLRVCTRQLANVMNYDHSTTIVLHLHLMGKVKKSGIWVPHALSENHKNQRVAKWCISACSSSIGS